jgi:hypothetical protein
MIKGMTLTMSVVILSVFTGIAHAGITSVASDRDEVPVFGKFEVTVGLDAAYSNRSDPEEWTCRGILVPMRLLLGRCPVFGAQIVHNYTKPVWKDMFSPVSTGHGIEVSV